MYNNAVAYQSELQEALAAAMNRLQEAMQDVHETQSRLGKADFQLGRTRYILRKNGYGEILDKKRGCTTKRTKLNGVTDSIPPLFPETDNLLTIPGRDRFTVRLD